MRKLIYLSVLMLVLVSCGREITEQEVLMLSTLQSNAQDRLDDSYFFQSTIKNIAEDKSSPERQKKARLLLNISVKMDSVFGSIISELNKLKLKIVSESGVKLKNSNDKGNYHYVFDKGVLNPVIIDFNKIKSNKGSIQLLENKQRIIDVFRKFRKEFCRELIHSQNVWFQFNKPYFFQDPNITNYSSIGELNRKLKIALDKSNVYIDEIHLLETVYKDLSLTDNELADLLSTKNNLANELSVLLSIETKVFSARKMLLSFWDMRVGHCCYRFQKLMPVVNGPNSADVGDTLNFSIFWAALDEDLPPTFNFDKGINLDRIENGVGYFSFVVRKAEDLTLKGTLSIFDQSYNVNTAPWSLKVKILPKPVQK